MKIKTFLGIILTIFLLLVIGFLLFNNLTAQNTVSVGDANFLLPEGYKENGVNKFGALTITNGKNEIYIIEQNDANVNKYILEYNNVVKHKNETMSIENVTINNTMFYKSKNINTPEVVHMWFVKNGKTYEIYKYDNNSKFEDEVIYLHNHMT